MSRTRKTINLTGIYSLTVDKVYVEPDIILKESRALYDAVKLYGADNLDVKYSMDGAKCHFTDLEMKTKALPAFIMVLDRRWKNGEHDKRLAQHYGLPVPISEILDTRKITKEKDDSSEYNIVNYCDLIENYLKM